MQGIIERIIGLTKEQVVLEDINIEEFLSKCISKINEEGFELVKELVKNNIDGIMEETFDLFNISVATYYIANSTFNINLELKKEAIVFDNGFIIKLLDLLKKINSYTHIETYFKSKSGINTQDELLVIIEELLILLTSFLNIPEELMHAKLDKWERKML
jgi:phosphoribosyl-ATP pyrophosphohydrolase